MRYSTYKDTIQRIESDYKKDLTQIETEVFRIFAFKNKYPVIVAKAKSCPHEGAAIDVKVYGNIHTTKNSHITLDYVEPEILYVYATLVKLIEEWKAGKRRDFPTAEDLGPDIIDRTKREK